jgi:hypothetical protein
MLKNIIFYFFPLAEEFNALAEKTEKSKKKQKNFG